MIGVVSELAGGDAVTVGIDVVGGIASLLTILVQQARLRRVHVPGLAVNRARQGTTHCLGPAPRRTGPRQGSTTLRFTLLA